MFLFGLSTNLVTGSLDRFFDIHSCSQRNVFFVSSSSWFFAIARVGSGSHTPVDSNILI